MRSKKIGNNIIRFVEKRFPKFSPWELTLNTGMWYKSWKTSNRHNSLVLPPHQLKVGAKWRARRARFENFIRFQKIIIFSQFFLVESWVKKRCSREEAITQKAFFENRNKKFWYISKTLLNDWNWIWVKLFFQKKVTKKSLIWKKKIYLKIEVFFQLLPSITPSISPSRNSK